MTRLSGSLMGGIAVASVTPMVIGKVPKTEGVPLIMPVVGFRKRPAGRLPEEMLHVSGAVPPVAASVAE